MSATPRRIVRLMAVMVGLVPYVAKAMLEKNLGEKTAEPVAAMETFEPDSSWNPSESQE